MNGSLTTLDSRDTDRVRTPLGEVQAQFDRAAQRLGLDSGTRQLLRSPLREHRVAVPVRMVLRKVDARMTSAFADVHERAEREQVSLRDGAYLIAVERVAHACRERGWV